MLDISKVAQELKFGMAFDFLAPRLITEHLHVDANLLDTIKNRCLITILG